MRAFFAFVLFGLVALVAGSIGYQAGLAATAGDAGRIIYWGGGPGLGTFVFLFFLLGLILLAFRPRRHRHWGRDAMMGGPAHWGGWSGWSHGPTGDPNDPRRNWVAEAHRRLHEEEARAGSAGTQPSSTPPMGGSGSTSQGPDGPATA